MVVHAAKELALEEILRIMSHAESDSSLVSLVPPVKPKAGDVFVYSHGDNRDRKDLVNHTNILRLKLCINV